MRTLTLRLPNERHERLKALSRSKRTFARAAHGDPQTGLDRLERHFNGEA